MSKLKELNVYLEKCKNDIKRVKKIALKEFFEREIRKTTAKIEQLAK